MNNRTGIIYKATCVVTNYGYIGQTTKPLAIRKQEHLQKAFGGSNTPFHRAIREHGEDAFIWEVLADEIPEDKLGQVEQSYIATFDTIAYGYNANSGGGGKKATPQLQPPLRWVSESELTLHWGLNRECNEEHVYALAQRMQTFGGFDADFPIGTIEIEGKLHVYSGHHRAAAAFKRNMPPQLFPLLPLAQVPVTVIQGDMDALIEKMWTTHDVYNSEDSDLRLPLSDWDKRKQREILMSFPHIYRLSSRKISKMWNVSLKQVDELKQYTRESLWRCLDMIEYPELLLDLHSHTPERVATMVKLVKVMEAETILREALLAQSEIPEQKIRWLNECLTLALPKSNDRLAALQILLKRLTEDL